MDDDGDPIEPEAYCPGTMILVNGEGVKAITYVV